MSEITNPHDRFFKHVFSNPENARDFLLHYLPNDIIQHIDPDSIQIEKDSFVDQTLQEHFSDLLFSVKTTNDDSLFIYLLFEHKSYPEPKIALQFLRYMTQIWIKNDSNEFLTPIIPLLVYHGKKPWDIPLDFMSLFSSYQ